MHALPTPCAPQVQSMSVLTLVLGAALLLWSHIIWCGPTWLKRTHGCLDVYVLHNTSPTLEPMALYQLVPAQAGGPAAVHVPLPEPQQTPLRCLSMYRRLVVLLLSMYRFQTWNIQNIDNESGQPLMGESAAPLAAGASQSVYAGSVASESPMQGPEGRTSEQDVAEGAGGGAAAASQGGLLRRVQFWKKSS